MRTPYGEDAAVKDFTVRTTGTVRLYGPEIAVVNSSVFQRLQGIKQLGTSYLVFRGAVHTRFEHSLGTVERAQRIIEAVNANPLATRQISERATRLARLTALLHDLPHIPFGHTLEDELNLFPRHDKDAIRIKKLISQGEIGAILERELGKGDLDVLVGIISANEDHEIAELGELAYVHDIVSNTVCADALDYVRRDSEACGMPIKLGERFRDFFVITPPEVPASDNRNRMALRLDKRGIPRPDVASEVIKMLEYRYELAERVYFHHAKNAGSVMIGRAVQALGLEPTQDGFLELSDETLMQVLRAPEVGGKLGLSIKASSEEKKLSSALADGVTKRRLYKLAYLGVAEDYIEQQAVDLYNEWGSDPEKRLELEDRFATMAGVAAGRVLIHLPSTRMAGKPADVRVLTADNVVTTLEKWDERQSRRAQGLVEAHKRLWRVGVYLHPEDARDTDVKELVRTAAWETFKLKPRYVESDALSPYLEKVWDMNVDSRAWPPGDRTEILREVGAAAAAGIDDAPGPADVVTMIDGVVAARAHSPQPGAEEHQPPLPSA